MPRIQYHWMDHKLARIIALLASILALLLATMIHKTYNPGHINSLHPEYVRCMEMRVEAIERMVAEKIITNQKATLFTKRAAALCGTEFPSP